MTTSTRTSFPLAELARIRGNKRTITPIHNNWCPSLQGLAECTCGDDLEYRLITVQKARVR